MLEQQLDVLVLEDALDLDRHRTARGWFAWRTANPNPRGSTLSGATAGVNPRNSHPALPDIIPGSRGSRPSWAPAREPVLCQVGTWPGSGPFSPMQALPC